MLAAWHDDDDDEGIHLTDKNSEVWNRVFSSLIKVTVNKLKGQISLQLKANDGRIS